MADFLIAIAALGFCIIARTARQREIAALFLLVLVIRAFWLTWF